MTKIIAIQHRRGSTEKNASFTGENGEITVDTTKKTLVVHDGSHVGGYPLPTQADISALSNTLQASINGKAAASHTHAIADIANLQSVLDGKQAAGSYAAADHTHSYLPLSGGTVWGDLTVTGTLKGAIVQATSDKRLKTEIQPVFFNLSSITSYRYKLKSDGAYHVGLIAQEVEKVIPEAVSEDENGMKSLDYNAVVAALVDEVNRLKVRLSVLEKNL